MLWEHYLDTVDRRVQVSRLQNDGDLCLCDDIRNGRKEQIHNRSQS